MTSLAFVFGVLPLAVSNGAGAGGQNAIGRAAVGGMLSATVFAIFFVPMFFVVVCRLFKHGPDDRATPQDDTSSGYTGHTTADGTTSTGSSKCPTPLGRTTCRDRGFKYMYISVVYLSF